MHLIGSPSRVRSSGGVEQTARLASGQVPRDVDLGLDLDRIVEVDVAVDVPPLVDLDLDGSSTTRRGLFDEESEITRRSAPTRLRVECAPVRALDLEVDLVVVAKR